MARPSKCKIVHVGKRRDGAERYWCLAHHADATAKYGRKASRCLNWNHEPILRRDTLRLDLERYNGGVGIWGAVPPVYDTALVPADIGIHVHARSLANAKKKAIDWTYRRVDILDGGVAAPPLTMSISEGDAISYMVSTVFGFNVEYLECEHCRYPHLDRELFSVHPHQRHLCAGCGRIFRAKDRGIGNPVRRVVDRFADGRCPIQRAGRSIAFKQSDFPGGVQIWASNPAIVWTTPRAEEEGIHIHAFDARQTLKLDETYSNIEIDRVALSPSAVRLFMAQLTIPHLARRVLALTCPKEPLHR